MTFLPCVAAAATARTIGDVVQVCNVFVASGSASLFVYK
jgi:hypothetical protein